MSMLRFEMDKRVGFREYMRSDGTRSYFFCLDTVRNLFVGAGFTEVLILLLYSITLVGPINQDLNGHLIYLSFTYCYHKTIFFWGVWSWRS